MVAGTGGGAMTSNTAAEKPEIGLHIYPEVLHRIDLTDREKIIFSAIRQLYKSNSKCYASNSYLSLWLSIPGKEVSVNVSSLVKKKLISRKIYLINRGGKKLKRRELMPNHRALRVKSKHKRVSRISGDPLP